jgi:DNA mismatch repair protein MutL
MHRHLTHIILEEYKHWIRDNEYPFFALFYELDPAQVDVNVHPSKMEIKFEDERSVAALTRSVIKRTLHQRFQVANLPKQDEDDFDPFMGDLTSRGKLEFTSATQMTRNIPSRINFDQTRSLGGKSSFTDRLYNPVMLNARSVQTSSDELKNDTPSYSNQRPDREKEAGFWQLHNTYIIAQTLTGLCLVDQHAAHKRIIYERALQAAASGLPSTQQLLFSESIQFSASDFAQLKNILPELIRMGFDISLMSGFTAIINGVPADINTGDEKSLIQSMLQQFQSYSQSLNLEPRERVALALASKTAIPRGKKLSLVEMETLVDQLFSCDHPYVDPLNKPTISYIALDDIRLKFRSH